MPLKLMYITNRPDVAQIAESAGVDRIFVDMEYIGKKERQGGMDTVQCHHTIADIAAVRGAIKKSELLVRCNPIYAGSEQEIEQIIEAGADIIMLPYFHTAGEAERFIEAVNGRVKAVLLVETPEAVENIDDILALDIDEVHIGLNDLSLGYHKKFMFELLSDGTVERLCFKFRQKGIPYGFGGIASIGKGELPAELIIKEHYRLGSTRAILSRSFCDICKYSDLDVIQNIFADGIKKIRGLERECEQHQHYFTDNKREVEQKIMQICCRGGIA